MISVIIPAQGEDKYLNATIDHIFRTCARTPEVIVVDNGGNGDIDKRAVVINPGSNVGERTAMNLAAQAATRDYLFRIDAHCDFAPQSWDVMLAESTGPKDITVAVLGAATPIWEGLEKRKQDHWLSQGKKPEDWQAWQIEKGHWYGLCRMIVSEDAQGKKGLECKWQKANRDHNAYKTLEANMGMTGCGFMIQRDFYWELGGADESLPAMGAIGEEFAIKAYAAGGKVQTHTDVWIFHIWGTGGYNTQNVKIAQQRLYEKYKDTYPSLAEKFPSFEGLKLVKTDQPGKNIRTVTVTRADTHDTTDSEGKLIRRKIEKFRYVWLESEHPDEKDWMQEQIELKYASQGVKIDEEILYVAESGELVPQAAAMA